MKILVKQFRDENGKNYKIPSDALSKAIERYKKDTNNLEYSFGGLSEHRKDTIPDISFDITHKISSIEQNGDDCLICEIETFKSPLNVLEEILENEPETLIPVVSGWADENGEYNIHSINFMSNIPENQFQCEYQGRLVNQGMTLCFADGDVNFPNCSEDCPKYKKYEPKEPRYTTDEEGNVVIDLVDEN